MNLVRPDTFEAGVRTAAEYLMTTAADFLEIASRLRSQPNDTFPSQQARVRNSIRTYEEQATLLRGQAQQILELKR